jgi:hypothetical protein
MPAKPPAKSRKPATKKNGPKRPRIQGPTPTPEPSSIETPSVEATTATATLPPVSRLDAAFMESEAQKKLEKIGAELLAATEENAELVIRIRLQDEQLTRASLKTDEGGSLVARAVKGRNEMTLLLARATDALRSTSITYHRADGHRGSHENCPDLFCRLSNDLWEEMGGINGVTTAQDNVQLWWDQREGVDGPEEEAPAAEETAAALEPLESGPVEKLADDPEWDAKYAGREARRLRVPDPKKEKDTDDPGMPKRASV